MKYFNRTRSYRIHVNALCILQHGAINESTFFMAVTIFLKRVNYKHRYNVVSCFIETKMLAREGRYTLLFISGISGLVPISKLCFVYVSKHGATWKGANRRHEKSHHRFN